MNVLIVLAHPEPKSFNASLKDLAVSVLTEQGHNVQVSDLYAMKWKAVADAEDFLDIQNGERLSYARESKHAFVTHTQSLNIEAEQRKLLWADAIIFQLPLWWFTMPAILKGWFERVYAYGFAYGVGKHEGERWGDRYGEGKLMGRRAMLSVTVGGRLPQYTERGVNGSIDDLLFPIHHGILWYPGMDVLAPFIVYQADRLTKEQYETVANDYRTRLENLFTDPTIPYRSQNGGHYDDQQVLKPEFGVGQSGFSLHLQQPNEAVDNRPQAQKEYELEEITN
ncbi:putative NAD(P)H quinone reductase [Calothrix sp. NIES-4071]|nr:putative NAD(P)H quinone reductase [Calothrix sp. NIES-4071]BAZ57774.1 putative NAD(P)H quinone reductase [Calothrix sp. NIES-4105]